MRSVISLSAEWRARADRILYKTNMATRRMISREIISTDLFISMSISAQALYMHLMVNTDDDGFVSNPQTVLRSIGGSKQDATQLIENGFVVPVKGGVVLIRHWHEQNVIKTNQYKRSLYLEDEEISQVYFSLMGKKLLELKNYDDFDQNLFKTCSKLDQNLSTGKDRLGKDRLGKENIYTSLFDLWNEQEIKTHKKITKRMKTAIDSLMKDFTEEEIKRSIINYSEILKSEDTYWTHKWTFEEFLKRGNGARVFVHKSVEDYKNDKKNGRSYEEYMADAV